MRNRPDSRHRLAALRAVELPLDAFSRPTLASPVPPPGVTGGWVPDLPGDEPAPRVPALHRSPAKGSDEDFDTDDYEAPEPDPVATSKAEGQTGPTEGGQSSGRARRVRHPRRRPWGRMAQRWVPETLRDSRIDPGRRGALLLAVVAAVAALVAAVGVWRDRPEPRPVQAVSLSEVTGTSDSASATRPGHTGAPLPALAVTAVSAAGTPVTGGLIGTSVIVVSVTGAVSRPGLVRLSVGARVADALEKVGGVTPQANLTGLNLAEKLTDGASVVVSDVAGPRGGNSSVSGSGSGSGQHPTSSAIGGKIDLNSADVAALDALSGVGPITAASIVAWRNKNGRFTSVAQLQEISGIGPAKYAALAPLVKV